MSLIIDFYDGTKRDSEGRSLDYILCQRLDWMETCHDYIQWLFPLREPSNFNPNAPLLTNEDVDRFKASFKNRGPRYYNFLRATDKMLYFLGLQAVWFVGDSGCQIESFELADNFKHQRYTWLEFNHNALRITRFLSCLSILGLNDYAHRLLAFMKAESVRQGVELSANTVKYWENAVTID